MTSQGCARFAEIWPKYFEFHILWSLCSVDFHTLTLQLPIQTPNSVAPELQVFVSSLTISAKRAHPCIGRLVSWDLNRQCHTKQASMDLVSQPICLHGAHILLQFPLVTKCSTYLTLVASLKDFSSRKLGHCRSIHLPENRKTMLKHIVRVLVYRLRKLQEVS